MEEAGDRELIQRASTGDQDAFLHLVTRHEAGLARYVRRLCPTPEASEDALQESLVAAWRAAGSYRGDASVRSWLYGMARRQAARTWRRRAGEPLFTEPLTPQNAGAGSDDSALGAAAGWGTADPERAAQAAEDHRRVHRALATLSPADREVLTLRDISELTGDEAAAILGIPVPAMKSRLHRARLRLMAALRQEESP